MSREYILENINMLLNDYLPLLQEHLEEIHKDATYDLQRNEDMFNLDRITSWLDGLKTQYQKPFVEVILTQEDIEAESGETISEEDAAELQDAITEDVMDHLGEYLDSVFGDFSDEEE